MILSAFWTLALTKLSVGLAIIIFVHVVWVNSYIRASIKDLKLAICSKTVERSLLDSGMKCVRDKSLNLVEGGCGSTEDTFSWRHAGGQLICAPSQLSAMRIVINFKPKWNMSSQPLAIDPLPEWGILAIEALIREYNTIHNTHFWCSPLHVKIFVSGRQT
jgi:hypothetical protein